MQTGGKPYPALIVNWLTPVYDLFARLFVPEGRIRRELIARSRLTAGDRILDLGAGSGTLAIMIKRLKPDVAVTALDGDPRILAIARDKAARAGAAVHFNIGNVTAVPYAGAAFDRVFSSLVLSLLRDEDKQRAIGEAYRVLGSGGELHIADFGPPRTWWARRVAPLVGRFEPTAGNLAGRIPAMCRAAGFESVEEVAWLGTLFGTLAILAARKGDGHSPESEQ